MPVVQMRQQVNASSSRSFLPPLQEVTGGLDRSSVDQSASGRTDVRLPDLFSRRVPSRDAETVRPKLKASASKPLSNTGRKLLQHLLEEPIKVETVDAIFEEHKTPTTLVNEREEVFGWPMLLFIANSGNLHALKILMDAQANLNAVDNLGNTALHLACRSDRVQVVEHLLARQAEVNNVNNNGWTALIWAAMSGHQQLIPRLLDAAADVNMVDDEGRTACMWAARHRHPKVLQDLLASGPDLKVRDEAGLSAIDHARECRQLRESLQKVDIVNRGLLDAAKLNQLDAVRSALNARANANASDEEGSALGWATVHGCVEIVQVLMKHGGNAALVRSPSALHDQHDAAVHAALQDALNVSNRFLDAARDGDWTTVSDALRAGAWIEVRDSKTFQTALIYAGVHGATDAVVELADAGANLERRDILGWTAVHNAAHYGWTATVSALYYVGADLFAQSYEGDLAQHFSARSDQWPVLHLLCASHADLNAQNVEGHTPLQEAVIRGSSAVISTLVANHADIGVKDGHERSVLSLAVVQGHISVVEALLCPLQLPRKSKGHVDPLADSPDHDQAADVDAASDVSSSPDRDNVLSSIDRKKKKHRKKTKAAKHDGADSEEDHAQAADVPASLGKDTGASSIDRKKKHRKKTKAAKHEDVGSEADDQRRNHAHDADVDAVSVMYATTHELHDHSIDSIADEATPHKETDVSSINHKKKYRKKPQAAKHDEVGFGADDQREDHAQPADLDAASVMSSSVHGFHENGTSSAADPASADNNTSVRSIDQKKKKPRKMKKKAAKREEQASGVALLPPLEVATSKDYLLARARQLRDVLPKDLPAALSAGSALAAPDYAGQAALALAVRSRHSELVPLLLQRKANVDAADNNGATALMLAANWGEPEVIEKMLQAGALVFTEDGQGKTSVDYACSAKVRRQLQEHARRVAVNQRLRATTSMPPAAGKSIKDGSDGVRGDNRASHASQPGLALEERPVYRLRFERLPLKLPVDMVENQILSVLKKHGKGAPARINVAADPITQRPRGYAYLDFFDDQKAKAVALAARRDPHEFFGTGVRVVLEGSPVCPSHDAALQALPA